MRVTGLGRGLSAPLEQWRVPRAVHDLGTIVADLAAAVALGGDCLADIAVLREQPCLAGPVASDPVVSRLVKTLAGDLPRALEAVRAARAAARERAWALAGQNAPGADGGLVTIDLDATIVIAHSERRSRPPRPGRRASAHTLLAYSDNTGEPLAGMLRKGSAGSNTASDHLAVLDAAIAALPPAYGRRLMVTADGAGPRLSCPGSPRARS
jgi:Transposase DDE domain group 1